MASGIHTWNYYFSPFPAIQFSCFDPTTSGSVPTNSNSAENFPPPASNFFPPNSRLPPTNPAPFHRGSPFSPFSPRGPIFPLLTGVAGPPLERDSCCRLQMVQYGCSLSAQVSAPTLATSRKANRKINFIVFDEFKRFDWLKVVFELFDWLKV